VNRESCEAEWETDPFGAPVTRAEINLLAGRLRGVEALYRDLSDVLRRHGVQPTPQRADLAAALPLLMKGRSPYWLVNAHLTRASDGTVRGIAQSVYAGRADLNSAKDYLNRMRQGHRIDLPPNAMVIPGVNASIS